MSDPKAEFPNQAFDRLSTAAIVWIGSADVKATALLGVSNILLGAVFLTEVSDKGVTQTTLRAAFVVQVFLLHAVVAAGVLWPRTNRRALLKEAGFPNPLNVSPSYFGDIAKLKYEEYAKLMQSTDSQAADREEQTFVLAVVAHKKMFAFRVAVALFLSCLFTFCALAAVSAHAARNAGDQCDKQHADQ